ncbi:cupin domain-containing protein [Sphingosinicella rhizophila]|uniref:Cupin domain-containing protein n=1 Tax=Sphingosinicella rhizophila TaxID=3050082 RepID=A0ABU3QBJ8_9SPHN|nr:cupin domain-containing protein [Sphingosinicella sp. GR2756]MDT9600774.1 cupin domain-containing protein [Sphingosinicella sp. GR2756]
MSKTSDPKRDSLGEVTRRSVVAGGGTVCFALLSEQALAATDAADVKTPAMFTFTKDSEAQGMAEYQGIHEGKGAGRVKFFRFEGAPAPANFIIYDLPPGSSEGVHVHFLDDRNGEGSFDEYYYIVSGRGQMEIDGEIVPVAAGDHVHTPLEVAHGIENTDATDNLKVFLTFIKRGNEPSVTTPPKP